MKNFVWRQSALGQMHREPLRKLMELPEAGSHRESSWWGLGGARSGPPSYKGSPLGSMSDQEHSDQGRHTGQGTLVRTWCRRAWKLGQLKQGAIASIQQKATDSELGFPQKPHNLPGRAPGETCCCPCVRLSQSLTATKRDIKACGQLVKGSGLRVMFSSISTFAGTDEERAGRATKSISGSEPSVTSRTLGFWSWVF